MRIRIQENYHANHCLLSPEPEESPEESTFEKSEHILSSNSDMYKSSNHSDDLNLPIATREGTRTCTKYLISKFCRIIPYPNHFIVLFPVYLL